MEKQRIYILCIVLLFSSISSDSKFVFVQKCEEDEAAWRKRENSFNCSDELTYHCILSVNDTLYELCMKEWKINPDATGCPHVYIPDTGYPELVLPFSKCPEDISGCPEVGHKVYFTNEVYKYPQCFLPEKERREIVSPKIPTNKERNWPWIVVAIILILVSVIVMIIVIIIVVKRRRIILSCIRRRRDDRKKTEQSILMLPLGEEESKRATEEANPQRESDYSDEESDNSLDTPSSEDDNQAARWLHLCEGSKKKNGKWRKCKEHPTFFCDTCPKRKLYCGPCANKHEKCKIDHGLIPYPNYKYRCKRITEHHGITLSRWCLECEAFLCLECVKSHDQHPMQNLKERLDQLLKDIEMIKKEKRADIQLKTLELECFDKQEHLLEVKVDLDEKEKKKKIYATKKEKLAIQNMIMDIENEIKEIKKKRERLLIMELHDEVKKTDKDDEK